LICEEFEDYNLIGITLSIRKKFNILEIWLKNREETKKMSTGEKIA
jgi:translation initiation factor 4E